MQYKTFGSHCSIKKGKGFIQTSIGPGTHGPKPIDHSNFRSESDQDQPQTTPSSKVLEPIRAMRSGDQNLFHGALGTNDTF